MNITRLMIMALSTTSLTVFAKKKASNVQINKRVAAERYVNITFDVHWDDIQQIDDRVGKETIGRLWVGYRLQGASDWKPVTLVEKTETERQQTDNNAFSEYAFAAPRRAAAHGRHSVIIGREALPLSGAADHQRVNLLWNYRADGVAEDDRVEISVSIGEKSYPGTQTAYRQLNKPAEENNVLRFFADPPPSLIPDHTDIYRVTGIPKNAPTTKGAEKRQENDNKNKEDSRQKEDDKDRKETEDRDEEDGEERKETEDRDEEDGEEHKKTEDHNEKSRDRENQAKKEAHYPNEQEDSKLDYTLRLALWMSAIVIGSGGKQDNDETESKTSSDKLRQSDGVNSTLSVV